jgi:hypothetical protein
VTVRVSIAVVTRAVLSPEPAERQRLVRREGAGRTPPRPHLFIYLFVCSPYRASYWDFLIRTSEPRISAVREIPRCAVHQMLKMKIRC